MTNSAVSVVITCYNLASYVGDAIESALQQSEDFERPIELIVIDDCSTDRSADVIRSFSEARYLRTRQNQGVLLAMLTAAEAATCDLLFFLDGDDLWERHKLIKSVAEFEANPRLGLITHDLNYADSSGNPLQRRTRVEEILGNSATITEDIPEKLRHGILSLGDYVWLGSAMGIRRSVVDFAGFARWARRLPDARNTYQDWPLAYWIAAHPDVEIAYVADKMFRYRLHRLNHSGDASTLERALRNFNRTLNTNLAIAEIARIFEVPECYHRAIAERIASNRYLIDLISGRRAQAAVGFARSVPDLLRRGLVTKELLRFVVMQLLGPNRGLGLAARRRFMQNLPPT